MTTRVEPPQLAILLADNERLRALAASVIHDFNNFAAAIGGYNELVLQPLAPQHEPARPGGGGLPDTPDWGAPVTRPAQGPRRPRPPPPTPLRARIAVTPPQAPAP